MHSHSLFAVDSDNTGADHPFGLVIEDQFGHAFLAGRRQRTAAGRPGEHALTVSDAPATCPRMLRYLRQEQICSHAAESVPINIDKTERVIFPAGNQEFPGYDGCLQYAGSVNLRQMPR